MLCNTWSVGGTPASRSWIRFACSRGPAAAVVTIPTMMMLTIAICQGPIVLLTRPAISSFVHVVFFISILLTKLLDPKK